MKQIDEIIRSLTFQISEMEIASKAAETSLRKSASDILRADDKLLSNLQKLASSVVPGRNEEDDTAQQVRELCARYIDSHFKFSVD